MTRWHPDRCSASGNLKYVEEAKKKFQAIQQAYSVLSDTNKRFLYDVGVYDCDDDDDENGMGDFLNEMSAMMGQNKSNENGGKGSSFEELKELFEDMFESDMEMDMNASTFDYSSSSSSSNKKKNTTTCFSAGSYNNGHDNNNNNKRASSEKSSQHSSSSSPAVLSFDANFNGFCFGAEQVESIGGGSSNAANRKKRTNGGGGGGGRKHKISTDHNDVSDYYYYYHYDNGGGGDGGGGISAA